MKIEKPQIPSQTEFTTPTENLVRLTPGQRPDAPHTQFTVFWLNDTAGTRVRGQVYNTNLDRFTAQAEAEGATVRVIA